MTSTTRSTTRAPFHPVHPLQGALLRKSTRRFGTTLAELRQLAAWLTGVCPGNNESAGKRHSGRTRNGNKYISGVLTQCGWAARKTDTHIGCRFRTLQIRMGGKKAALATAHEILATGYHLLVHGVQYDDAKVRRPKTEREARSRNRALQILY